MIKMLPILSNSRGWMMTVVGIILLSLVHRGAAIMCWECNSRTDHDCRDPFSNHSIALVDCDQKTYTRTPGLKATICRKIIQKIRDEYRYIRGCGWVLEEKEGMECIKRAGTFSVMVTYCSCDHDSCNGAPASLKPSWMMAILVLASTAFTHVPFIKGGK